MPKAKKPAPAHSDQPKKIIAYKGFDERLRLQIGGVAKDRRDSANTSVFPVTQQAILGFDVAFDLDLAW